MVRLLSVITESFSSKYSSSLAYRILLITSQRACHTQLKILSLKVNNFCAPVFAGALFFLKSHSLCSRLSPDATLRIYDFLAYSAGRFLFATQPAWIRRPWLSHAFRRRPVCELLNFKQNMRNSIYSPLVVGR